MTKNEIDAMVLDFYQSYPSMNEDLKGDIVVWLLSNAANYDNTITLSYLVGEAKEDILNKTINSSDALDAEVKKSPKDIDNFYDLVYSKKERCDDDE